MYAAMQCLQGQLMCNHEFDEQTKHVGVVAVVSRIDVHWMCSVNLGRYSESQARPSVMAEAMEVAMIWSDLVDESIGFGRRLKVGGIQMSLQMT